MNSNSKEIEFAKASTSTKKGKSNWTRHIIKILCTTMAIMGEDVAFSSSPIKPGNIATLFCSSSSNCPSSAILLIPLEVLDIETKYMQMLSIAEATATKIPPLRKKYSLTSRRYASPQGSFIPSVGIGTVAAEIIAVEYTKQFINAQITTALMYDFFPFLTSPATAPSPSHPV